MVKISIIISVLSAVFFLGTYPCDASFTSISFYYGKNPPVDELKAFDLAVIDPDQGVEPNEILTGYCKPIAYVSIGEADPKRSYTSRMSSGWFIGENRTWGTRIIDQSNPVWQKFFLEDVLEPLWQRGYRGFFLDTVDSYRLAGTSSDPSLQEKGLVTIITSLKKRHPEAVIILNRGFEILPKVAGQIDAVVAESLFKRWDESKKSYGDVPDDDREWLVAQMKSVRESGAVPVVIDYLPPGSREKARETARRIMELGFVPWVTDRYVESLGTGSVEVMPRRIIGIYDGSESEDPVFTLMHQLAETPLNYLGYMLEMHDVRNPLPDLMPGRYAGIVVWANSYNSGIARNLDGWLLKQISEGLKVAFMENFGVPPTRERLAPFGLEATPAPRSPSLIRIVNQASSIGYEIQPAPVMNIFTPLKTREGTSLLTVENEAGIRSDAVAITPWGGYALFPYALARLPDKQSRWVIDPFTFFRDALRLPVMPVPDVTTESGRRLMLVHVDGDGFMEQARWGKGEFAGEVAFKQIFSKFMVPSTVSIIQGEIAPDGMYPDLSSQLEPIARRIFALPWVEIASHSYSHPFHWGKVVEKRSGGKYHLAIPGYEFSLDAEIRGSVEYINRKLAPPGKSPRIFLWTGNCLPTEQTLEALDAIGIAGMNGGDTTITESQKSVANVAPLGIRRGRYFQVYAPNQNENVYTNLWTGPFYGYERVVETFRLTDTPLRLKPINIYYHFYSASRQASLNALQKVYEWALGQNPLNIYASEYVSKVHDFNRTVVARSDNGWVLRNSGQLREFRIPAAAGFPDMEKSRNVAGFKDHGDHRYIHTAAGGESLISIVPEPPATPYLQDANGRVTGFERNGTAFRLTLDGYLPLSFTLGGVDGYSVAGSASLKHQSAGEPGKKGFVSSRTGETIVISKKP